MDKTRDIIKEVNGHLFWDVNISDLDSVTSKRLIIERVFSLGNMADMRSIIAYYGREKVVEELVKLNYLDPKTLNFVSILFDKPKQKFKCYTPKPSSPPRWNS